MCSNIVEVENIALQRNQTETWVVYLVIFVLLTLYFTVPLREGTTNVCPRSLFSGLVVSKVYWRRTIRSVQYCTFELFLGIIQGPLCSIHGIGAERRVQLSTRISHDSEACSYTSALRSGLPGGALQNGPHIMRYFFPMANDWVWLLTTSTRLILCYSSTKGEGSVRPNVLVAGNTGGPSESDLGSGYHWYCAHNWQDETSLIRTRTLAQAQSLIDRSILIILI